MKLTDFCRWFEDKMEKEGFWDGDRWNEYNEKGEAFEDIASDVMSDYNSECEWDWDIVHEHMFESPGIGIYATAISVAFYSEKSMLSTYSLLYTTYCC